MLTGDKVETAISIALSCRLFCEDMALVELRERDFISAAVNAGAIQQVGRRQYALHAMWGGLGMNYPVRARARWLFYEEHLPSVGRSTRSCQGFPCRTWSLYQWV